MITPAMSEQTSPRTSPPPERHAAQQRADAIHAFQAELACFDAAGVLSLSATQQQALTACHEALLAILVGAALASLDLTLWRREPDASGYFSKLAALVAFACFVLNLSMLDQIFNLTPLEKALLP